ncbi:MerR family transcriptional regulator [Nonomuraea sp. H19]|uniref:MerR family transcriptional regulator n=1 Tax=Nonomuraea sp. H19 TaxID=3452206 RepID=UPI003F889CDD
MWWRTFAMRLIGQEESSSSWHGVLIFSDPHHSTFDDTRSRLDGTGTHALVGELARRTNVTVRALRYYEKAGLVVPRRLPNGYRHYDPVAVRQVEEIKELTNLGLSMEETRPFVECLASGHASGDECPASLAAYRYALDQMTQRIERLVRRRDALAAQLEAAAGRAIPSPGTAPVNPAVPVPPQDDGAAAHLAGLPMPALALPVGSFGEDSDHEELSS